MNTFIKVFENILKMNSQMTIYARQAITLLVVCIFCLDGCSLVRKRIYGSEIKAVFAQDQAAYNTSQKDIEAGATKTEALSTYTKSMRKIDTSDCPRGFRTAYLKHVQAWETVVQKMKEKETTSTNRLLISLFALFIGQPQVALTSFLSELQSEGVDTSSIKETWNNVEIEAQRYNVSVE